MVLDERQQAIDSLLSAWDAGRESEATAALLELVKKLWGVDEPMLTTAEAARALGIRSVNTLKVLLRSERVPIVKHGNRTMVPFSTLARLRHTSRTRDLRAIDQLHDEITGLGSEEGMTEEQLSDLSASRPGVLPWKQ